MIQMKYPPHLQKVLKFTTKNKFLNVTIKTKAINKKINHQLLSISSREIGISVDIRPLERSASPLGRFYKVP